MLSMAGRVESVKSVIHSMLNYSFMIYSWPVSLVKSVDRWIRNFIWGGDVESRKLATMAWKKVCKPVKEGGLGLRSLRCTNNAAMLKLCWEFNTSNMQWSNLIRARVFKKNGLISYHIGYSIWPGLKPFVSVTNQNLTWQIGNGKNISDLKVVISDCH